MTILFIPFDFRFFYESVFPLPILEILLYGFIVSGSVFPILSITPAAIYYLVEEMGERNLCLDIKLLKTTKKRFFNSDLFF